MLAAKSQPEAQKAPGQGADQKQPVKDDKKAGHKASADSSKNEAKPESAEKPGEKKHPGKPVKDDEKSDLF
jgi:hypothetical protein